ncbi:unnamed protein product [Caenorhabditis angaria]|uniref:EamA domain-containing protein n=1 Tax=Caenorhabditis angaria TaxID=860376 RepID=A0A9P1IFR1_9PELO|nr:unnamed protein product [Caenorhabditis angaria]
MDKSVVMAGLAGICGATGAISGKLAFDGGFDQITTFSCLAVFIVANIAMWATYTRSLALSTSTSTPLLINMSFNFAVTGIMGKLVFNESHSEIWWFFLSLLILGLVMLLGDSSKTDEEKND